MPLDQHPVQQGTVSSGLMLLLLGLGEVHMEETETGLRSA
jgi:hypothetical protein